VVLEIAQIFKPATLGKKLGHDRSALLCRELAEY
jgi:hypothetical protein